MRILYNKERFNPTKYGDDRIIKESGMNKMQFDPRSPSFLMLNFMLLLLVRRVAFYLLRTRAVFNL